MGTSETLTQDRVRAGGRVLAVLERPLNCLIVRALGKEPMRLADLLKELGAPAPTTMRARLVELKELGVIAKQGSGMPYAVENALTDVVGRDLLTVVESLSAWLSAAPQEPIPLGSVAARGAIKALARGWESTMLRAFAARPLSLTQLDSLIADLSYPALERRLASMRATGLVQPVPNGTRTPYVVSHWGRRGMGPLAAAARFERTHMLNDPVPLMPIDVEAAFLLATPIVELSRGIDGSCQLVAQVGQNGDRQAGVKVTADRGRVVECVARLEPKARNWALGDAEAWLEAVVRRRPEKLRISGDHDLVRALVCGLHDVLFSAALESGASAA